MSEANAMTAVVEETIGHLFGTERDAKKLQGFLEILRTVGKASVLGTLGVVLSKRTGPQQVLNLF